MCVMAAHVREEGERERQRIGRVGGHRCAWCGYCDGAVAAAKLKSVVTLSILNSTGGVLKTLYGAGA